MSDPHTTVKIENGRVTVQTGELITVWRFGDCHAAMQVSVLHEMIWNLRAEIDRLRKLCEPVAESEEETRFWNKAEKAMKTFDDQLPMTELNCLRYIAESPASEHGGFHPNTVAAAKWAIAEIENMQELLETACDAWECGGKPINIVDGGVYANYRYPLLSRAWYDAARQACGPQIDEATAKRSLEDIDAGRVKPIQEVIDEFCRGQEQTATADWFAKQPYSSAVIPDQSGGFTSYVLEFPGCLSQGETLEEAMANLREAAASWISAAREQDQEIPAPFYCAWSTLYDAWLPQSRNRASRQATSESPATAPIMPCGQCGRILTLVRPGGYQCDYYQCEHCDAPKPQSYRPWVREHRGDMLWHWFPEALGPSVCGLDAIFGTPLCLAGKPQNDVCPECSRKWDMAVWAAMERNTPEQPVKRSLVAEDEVKIKGNKQ